MTWPIALVPTTNSAAGTDSPASFRGADLQTLIALINQIISNGDPLLKTGGTLTGAVKGVAATLDDHLLTLGQSKNLADFPTSPLAFGPGVVSLSMVGPAIRSQWITLAATTALTLTLPTGAAHGQQLSIAFSQGSAGGGFVSLSGPAYISGRVARAANVTSWLHAIFNSVTSRWEGTITQAALEPKNFTNSDGLQVNGESSAGVATYSGMPTLLFRYGAGQVHFSLNMSWSTHTGTGAIQVNGFPEVCDSGSALIAWWLVPTRVTVGTTRYDGASLVFDGTNGRAHVIDSSGNRIALVTGAGGFIQCSGSFPLA